jgi:hypothetical protein
MPESLGGFLKSMGCSDADWALDTVDRKSISGYSFYFQESLVSWSSIKQVYHVIIYQSQILCHVPCFQSYMALSISWFLRFSRFMFFPIFSDNQATCSLSHSSAISAHSKHINIQHHFIWNLVQDGSFITTWIPTTDMPADIFTKSLNHTLFSKHWSVLGLSIPLS